VAAGVVVALTLTLAASALADTPTPTAVDTPTPTDSPTLTAYGRSGQKPPQRRRGFPWSDRTVDQVVAPPNRVVLGSSGAAAGTGPEAA